MADIPGLAFGTVTGRFVRTADDSDDTGTTPAGVLWEDAFDRADAADWAAVGGGWYASSSNLLVAIASNALVLSAPGGEGYRLALNPAGGSLPADFEVELGFTGSPGAYWGLAFSWDPTDLSNAGDGAKVLFTSMTNIRVGRAYNASNGSAADISAALPATWGDSGAHTLRIRREGSRVDVICDGTNVGYWGVSTNASEANRYVGICGEAQGRAWDYIRVTPI